MLSCNHVLGRIDDDFGVPCASSDEATAAKHERAPNSRVAVQARRSIRGLVEDRGK